MCVGGGSSCFSCEMLQAGSGLRTRLPVHNLKNRFLSHGNRVEEELVNTLFGPS